MHRIRIHKESTPASLEEKITIVLDREDVKKYVDLLQKTWPQTRVEDIKKYA